MKDLLCPLALLVEQFQQLVVDLAQEDTLLLDFTIRSQQT